MRTFHLKSPEIVSVIGTTEAGDYIVVDATQGDKLTVEIRNKAEFDAKYVEDVLTVSEPKDIPAATAPVSPEAHDGQPKPAVQA